MANGGEGSTNADVMYREVGCRLVLMHDLSLFTGPAAPFIRSWTACLSPHGGSTLLWCGTMLGGMESCSSGTGSTVRS